MRTDPGSPRPIVSRLALDLISQQPVSSVLLVPSASLEPHEAVNTYTRAFSSLGVHRIHVLDVRSRADAESSLR